VLTSVTANDVDTNPALTYGFSTESDSEVDSSEAETSGFGVFSIDRFSGKVILVRSLDFESQREYRLRVTASDTAHTARTVLTIRVTDVNDNPPIFMQSSYQASLPGEYSVIFLGVACRSYLSFCVLFRCFVTSVWAGYGSVGIAIRYGMDGPGIEYRRELIFSTRIQNDPRAHPAYCTRGTGPLPAVKRSERGVDQRIPSST